ncbi:MAG TPA: VWA domain-containing protein [Gaiellaceae bacterium]|nr:VWA domain-containing protein [Gaiellaceae bacterium]
MPGSAIVRHVAAFGRVLREVGIEVGPGRVVDAVRGLAAVDVTREEDVYFTLRQTLVSRHDELELFDRAFAAWFLRGPVAPLVRERQRRQLPGQVVRGSLQTGRAEEGEEAEAAAEPLELGASGHELLREKDFAEMTAEEFERARRLMEAIARARPQRVSRRRAPDPRGDRLDMRRLLRRSLRSGGDPVEQPWKSRKLVPRKLVVLCDVSGSMDRYSRALLLFLHALVGAGRGVEAFAFGTRLTRLTPDFATRDPEAAIARATAAAVDWGSGTRIGASLAEFNAVYGRRALSRGAVVVIVSDGWERDDPGLIGREMARLQRAAYAVVWVNPLKGSPEYQPLAGGMRAALPFVDRFLPGHNLRSLEELAAVLAGIERRHAA